MPEVLMVAALCAVILFAVCQFWALRKWKRAWRFAAAVPGVAFCLVAAKLVFDLSLNPASHKMWPFELLGWSVIGLLILGVVAVVRLVRIPRPLGR